MILVEIPTAVIWKSQKSRIQRGDWICASRLLHPWKGALLDKVDES